MRVLSGVSEAELHAYVDGQLSEDRAREVATWLSDHSAEGLRVGGWRAQNEAIRRAFPPPIRERLTVAFRAEDREPAAHVAQPPVAPRLENHHSRRRRQRMLASALAFLAGALVAGIAGLLIQRLGADARRPVAIPVDIVHPASDLADLATGAWRAYAEDRQRPVEMTARDRGALLNWLSDRTGLGRLPESGGARLIGGRVMPGRDANAAFLLYETGDGERLALVAQRAAGVASSETPRAAGGLRMIVWRSNAYDFALASKLPEARLKAFAGEFAESLRTP